MSDMDDTETAPAAAHPGYAVFDTEGTGLFDYKQPADAKGQPRMASLAILYVNEALDICKIPPKGNRGGYKWPALSEALLFIGSQNLGDHSAINDAKGALDLLRYMKRHGLMPEGKVHYAKGRD